jgi:hypothetical protein
MTTLSTSTCAQDKGLTGLSLEYGKEKSLTGLSLVLVHPITVSLTASATIDRRSNAPPVMGTLVYAVGIRQVASKGYDVGLFAFCS